ncbi:hypothetical protein [Nocardia salmonicida]|uniref:hypothetical protein n=1 Tax=Nocardia salmonicida TaxID=53431 RepID=UPI002E27C2AC|nr:hypothetical protein [Nocardia salmonicida]
MRFLLTVPRRELLGSSEIPDDIAEELRRLDQTLSELFVNLSRRVFDRAHLEAVAVIRDCVVELPTALLLRGRRNPDPAVRQRLARGPCPASFHHHSHHNEVKETP